MTALFAPAVSLLALALSEVGQGKEPTKLDSAVPTASGAVSELVTLAEHNRDRWQKPKGDWEFKPDSLTGSGDCRIDLRGPFAVPFTLDFRINVLKGMRPRVFLGPIIFANEKYERTFSLYPEVKG